MRNIFTLCALLFLSDSVAMDNERLSPSEKPNRDRLKTTHLMRLSMHCYDEETDYLTCYATITSSPAYKLYNTQITWQAQPIDTVVRIYPDFSDEDSETVTVHFRLPKEK